MNRRFSSITCTRHPNRSSRRNDRHNADNCLDSDGTSLRNAVDIISESIVLREYARSCLATSFSISPRPLPESVSQAARIQAN